MLIERSRHRGELLLTLGPVPMVRRSAQRRNLLSEALVPKLRRNYADLPLDLATVLSLQLTLHVYTKIM